MKPNNLVALFIVVILIVIGVALAVIKHQSPARQEAEDAVLLDIRLPADTGNADTMNQVAHESGYAISRFGQTACA